jgi:hypothetical protein
VQGEEDLGTRNLTATHAQATGCGARREPAKWKTSRGRTGGAHRELYQTMVSSDGVQGTRERELGELEMAGACRPSRAGAGNARTRRRTAAKRALETGDGGHGIQGPRLEGARCSGAGVVGRQSRAGRRRRNPSQGRAWREQVARTLWRAEQGADAVERSKRCRGWKRRQARRRDFIPWRLEIFSP